MDMEDCNEDWGMEMRMVNRNLLLFVGSERVWTKTFAVVDLG